MDTILAHSDQTDTDEALAELVATAQAALQGRVPKGALLFCSVEYEHERLLAGIQRTWPGLPIVGGSSDGEISTSLGFCHDSVLLTLFAGDDVEVRASVGRDLSAGIDAAVEQSLATLGDFAPRLCISMFAPTTNSSEVVRRLDQRLGRLGCPVVGGLTGDHREFSRTKEFFGTEVLRDSLPLLFVRGSFALGFGVGSGWFPIGERFRVTRSDGHIVHEIDGRPAIEVYRRHYGAVPDSSLGEYPLAVFAGSRSDAWFLRAILDSNAQAGWLRFAGEVPTGSQVSLTEVLPEGLLSGSSQSLRQALAQLGGAQPQIAFVFSCAARKWVLGTDAVAEIALLRECAAELGVAELDIAGLYCYGEISPTPARDASFFHNETCVSVVLGR